jgi:hypothetical protein
MKRQTLWTFAGYETAAGGRIVQDWYDSLPVEEYEELQDTLNYLADTKDWRRPEFDKVTSPLHEIRSKANCANHLIRVYGFFDPKIRRRFVMLHGNESKKVGYDKKGQEIALNHLSLLKQGKASTHEFAVERESAEQNQKE